jgi:type I restriction enzyme S subunit
MSSKKKTTATKEEARPALVPKLRFPEFRDAAGWKPSVLADACDMQAGKFVSASNISERNQDGLFPCYGGNGLRGYTATHTHNGTYPLVGRQGALCGNVRLATGQFHATEHAVVATPKKGIDVVWLFYSLDLLNLNRFATGQAQPGLSVDVLENVSVAIPTLEPEQQKIAECLSSVDELIAAQARKLDALKTHKKGLMQQLFPREGETQPRLRFPEFENGGEWAEKALGAMSKTTIGEFVIKTKQRPDAPYPVFNGGRSHTGFYDQFNNEGNKIVISARGANAGYVNIVQQRYWAGNSCYSVSLKDSNDCLEFVYWFMKQNEKTFTENQHAANIPAVSKGHVECFKIMLPSPKEQQRIASCLSSLDALITAETHKHEALKSHKKGLMQQLFPSPEEVVA